MWPLWTAIMRAAASRSRERRAGEASDGDVREAVEDVETDAEKAAIQAGASDDEDVSQAIAAAHDRAESVAEATQAERGTDTTDLGIGCVGGPGDMTFAPAEDFEIHELSNATVAKVNGERWIDTSFAVDVGEWC